MATAEQQIGAIEVEFIRRLLLLTLGINVFFIFAHTLLGNNEQALLNFAQSVSVSTSLWLFAKGKTLAGIHLSAWVVATCVVAQVYVEYSVTFWIAPLIIGYCMVLGRQGFWWAVYLIVILMGLLYFDSMSGEPRYTFNHNLNLITALVILIVLCLLAIRKYQQMVQAAADTAEQLAIERAERKRENIERNFAGSLAHLINNEMQAISADSELLELCPGEDTNEKLRRIRETAMKASSHANQMLAYTGHVQQHKIKEIDINELISGCMSVNSENIELTCVNQSADPLLCRCDAEQIRQVICGLLENAREACDSDCRIKLNVQCKTEEGKAWAVIAVRDNGTGIIADELDQIFHPFYTTKFTGRGLGLSAAFGIIKGHGGRIEVESEIGKGSVFTVWLPVSTPVSVRAC